MISEKHERTYRIKRLAVIAICILLLLVVYFFKNASFFLREISFIGFVAFFYLVDHFFDIRFELKHYIFILIIGVTGLLMSSFYFVYPNYDKVQHLLLPILVSSMVFHMVNKLNLELKWKIVFTLFITIGILGVFEIGEYGLDKLFDLKLQGVYLRDIEGLQKFNLLQDPIDDTMIDLSLGLIGSIIYAIFTILTYKIKVKKRILK